jgi:serine/threonine protein kinase
MVSLANPAPEFDRREPIPGYTTTELLGRGGYGEVWKAVAPGGLAKAVKIVYGDDPEARRVSGELKALSRIKDVRHPLLLSIERIEVAAGNLVIVTELADCSLRQHFQRCREANSVGIEQGELLGLLGDAADALDFLYRQFSLQHLDVKPENILLIGGRAKVGDFGLVKHLYERSASLVGGMTPTYSPPEMFEGKPSRNSDQYSLAVVYVQMLTGLLPFQAGNTAQLAQQHLRGVPDLSNLPKGQRPVIARALSKDPVRRYESCQAMIEALKASLAESVPDQKADSSPRAVANPSSDLRRPAIDLRRLLPGVATRSDPPPARKGAAPQADETCRAPSRTEKRRAAPPAVGDDTPAARPALVIGLGGAASEVCARLVDRLQDSTSSENRRGAVRLLLLDTDGKALAKKFAAGSAGVRLLPLRLQSADAYGPRSAEILAWLNRRWFYNIPRDRTTGGYRPLGRLALVTSASGVREAVADVVAEASGAAAGGPRPPTPRIFVVGSLGGATAGGTLIDVAYLVRAELKKQGLPDDDVQGVLLHSTPRASADRDKSLASAFATLHELVHFSRPGSHFPGEPLLGVPPFHGDNATFARIHVLRLGEGLGRGEWMAAAESAAELLYCSLSAPEARLLESRPDTDRAQRSGAGGGPWARTCSVLSFGVGLKPLVSRIAWRACLDVVRLWREGHRPQRDAGTISKPTAVMNAYALGATPSPTPVEAEAKQKLVEFGLAVEQLHQDASDILALEAGCDAEEFIRRLVDEAPSADGVHPAPTGDEGDAVLAKIDRVLSYPDDDQQAESPGESLCETIAARLAVRAGARTEAFLEAIRQMIDTATIRVDGARQFTATAMRLLQEMRQRLTAQSRRLRDTAMTFGVEADAREGERREKFRMFGWPKRQKDPGERRRQVLSGYARNRLHEALCHAVAGQIQTTEVRLAALAEQLGCLSQRLDLLARTFVETPEDTSADRTVTAATAGSAAHFKQMLLEQLNLNLHEIAQTVEKAIDESVLAGGQGLRRFLDPGCEPQALLARPLTELSRRAVLNFLTRIVCRFIQAPRASSRRRGAPQFVDLLQEVLAAEGDSTEHGARERLLVVPQDADLQVVHERIKDVLPDVSVVGGPTCDVTLCTVQGEVPLEQVARDMIGGIDAFEELASRLHTRIDVQWTPLSVAESAGSQAAENSTDVPLITHTAVIPAAKPPE